MLPLVILQGKAKSGKDTFADFLVQDHGMIKLAMADSMKAVCKLIFGFTDDQLWGESRELKEKPDERWSWTNDWNWVAAESKPHQDPATINWCTQMCPKGFPVEDFRERLSQWVADLNAKHQESRTALSPRVALQTLGTEFGRAIRKNLWVDLAIGQAKQLLSTPHSAYSRDLGVYMSKPEVVTPTAVVITDGRFFNEVIEVKAAGGVAVRIVNPTPSTTQVGIAGHPSELEMEAMPESWFDYLVVNDKSKGLDNLRQQAAAVAADLKHTVVVP